MNFKKLEEYMNYLVNECNVPGVDCSVYKEHEEVFRYFTGKRNVEENKQMMGNELYIIYSMTKMITCTCALQLLEQGKYLLSDSVSKYLPEFKKMKISEVEQDDNRANAITTGSDTGSYSEIKGYRYAQNQITIKDLFTMSAGLDYNLSANHIKTALLQGKTSTRDIVRSFSQTVLSFEPGTRFQYSLCHDVLGALIEVVSGKNLGEYMMENLFEPLNMKDTFFGVPKDEGILSRMVGCYAYNSENRLEKRPLECMYNITEEYQSGGAGLISSVNDYAVFLDALANNGVGKNGKKILASSTIELMGTNHLKGKQLDDFFKLRNGYGYGLGVRTHIDKTLSGSLSTIGEFGWDGAAGAFSLVDPVNKLSFAYFQQVFGWDIRIHNEMRNILYACLK